MIDPSLGRALIRILLAYDEENHDDYIETGEGISEGLKFGTFCTRALAYLKIDIGHLSGRCGTGAWAQFNSYDRNPKRRGANAYVNFHVSLDSGLTA